MTTYRVSGSVGSWNAVRIKYGRESPSLFLKILSATTSTTTQAATVFLDSVEYRFLRSELDAFDMVVTQVKPRF